MPNTIAKDSKKPSLITVLQNTETKNITIKVRQGTKFTEEKPKDFKKIIKKLEKYKKTISCLDLTGCDCTIKNGIQTILDIMDRSNSLKELKIDRFFEFINHQAPLIDFAQSNPNVTITHTGVDLLAKEIFESFLKKEIIKKDCKLADITDLNLEGQVIEEKELVNLNKLIDILPKLERLNVKDLLYNNGNSQHVLQNEEGKITGYGEMIVKISAELTNIELEYTNKVGAVASNNDDYEEQYTLRKISESTIDNQSVFSSDLPYQYGFETGEEDNEIFSSKLPYEQGSLTKSQTSPDSYYSCLTSATSSNSYVSSKFETPEQQASSIKDTKYEGSKIEQPNITLPNEEVTTPKNRTTTNYKFKEKSDNVAKKLFTENESPKSTVSPRIALLAARFGGVVGR